MHLRTEQQRALRERSIYAVSACDKCGQVLGGVRYTRRGEPGEWCSELCRDGVVIDHAARRNLRKRSRQAAAMRRLSRTEKSVAAAATI